MNKQLVKLTSQFDYYPDSAARLIELLKVHSWNTAVRILKAEKDVKFCSVSEVGGKSA